MGLHQRYARWLGHLNGDTIATFSHQDEVRKQLTHLFDGMMKALYRQEGANLDINIIASDEAQQFITTHAGALDASFSEVKMSDIMRQRLQRSNYIFSGMKTFHELNEAFPSLLDENGNRKSFERFLNDVRKIDSTYNSNYLRAEYNYVQASAQMAARWEEFAADGDRYNLQYRTMGDAKVRPAHADLHGVTLPMSDPFWEEFYPPNGWNCRCTVVQVRKSKYPATDHDEAMALGELATGKDTKGIFRFNSGKEQKTVPDYNPYTIRRCKDCDIAKGKMNLAFISDNELCEACKILHSQCLKQTTEELYHQLLTDKDYTDVQYDPQSGGLKATHVGHAHIINDKERKFFDGLTGYDLERECQDILFRMGHTAILRDESKELIKGQVLPSLDLELDGQLVEIRNITEERKDNYGNALDAKNRHLKRFNAANNAQADAVLLYFHDATFYSEERILNSINYLKGIIRNEKPIRIQIKHIYCVVNGQKALIKFDI